MPPVNFMLWPFMALCEADRFDATDKCSSRATLELVREEGGAVTKLAKICSRHGVKVLTAATKGAVPRR